MLCEHEPVICVEGVSKTYRLFNHPFDRIKQLLMNSRGHTYYTAARALQDVSFEVLRGEAVGIVGRNGSGKSTLLQIICGTMKASSGAIRVRGRVSPLLELGSGFNPEFTGRENIYLSAAVLGLTREQTLERFDAIASFAALGNYLDRAVKTYSSGMFARLAFSVAVHVDPDVLVVDETLSVGDIGFQQKCIRRMFELRSAGATLLFVSHDPYQVKTVCERALYLRDGQLIHFGDASSVVDSYLADLHTGMTDSGGATGQLVGAEDDCGPYQISSVQLLDEEGIETNSVTTGATVSLSMDVVKRDFHIAVPVSFVFNLYRGDGLYICGTTTLMDGHKPVLVANRARVKVEFPAISLLAGRYFWRVAVNDEHGLSVLAKLEGVCPFIVEDRFSAVGIVNLARAWAISPVMSEDVAE